MVAPAFNLIGKGVYSLYEAHRLTEVPRRSIVRWTRGYDFTYRGQKHHSKPIVQASTFGAEEEVFLTFKDIIEMRFVHAFRKHNVSWPEIRKASERASEIIGSAYPFSTKRFSTDGRRILADFVNDIGDPVLLSVVHGQVEMREVVSPMLYAGIDFGTNEEPDRWWPVEGSRRIVVDPARQFGAPLVDEEGVQTMILARAAIYQNSIEVVADQYEVDPISVAEAVEFELSRPR